MIVIIVILVMILRMIIMLIIMMITNMTIICSWRPAPALGRPSIIMI